MVDVKLVSLPGDGIGTEVVNATIGVLREAGDRWGARFIVEPVEAGAARYARTGVVYSEADFEICRAADVILMGALGLPDIVHRDGTEAGPDLQFRLNSISISTPVSGPSADTRRRRVRSRPEIPSASRSFARIPRDCTPRAAAAQPSATRSAPTL